MTPKILMYLMAALCLVAVPYLYLTFKKLWSIPSDAEHEPERKAVAKRIVIILGTLGVLAFLLPLLLKFNSDYDTP